MGRPENDEKNLSWRMLGKSRGPCTGGAPVFGNQEEAGVAAARE